MLNVQRGPSTVLAQGFDERITAILEEPGPDHEDVRNRRIRHRLVRRLLDDTVVFYDDLTPDERAYFVSQRPHIVAEIQEATGLLAEARAEGVAMVDERNELSDVAMPEDGTEGHVTLLVAEFLAAQIRTAPRTPVPLAAIHARVAEAADTHRSHWRSDAQEPGAEVGLCRLALDRLVALRLARVGPDGIVPLPPVGRYAIPREVPATPAASELAGTPARRRERSRRQRPTG